MKYDNVSVETKDKLTLKGWLILQEDALKKDTVVFMHENAGNIGLRMDYFEILHKLGFNILCVAYRGFSDSQGLPTEAGLKLDGHAISECVQQQRGKINLDRLFLCGRSLGGAVAINLLS